MRRIRCYILPILAVTITFALSSCSNPCKNGHTWQEATCTSAKTCSVCEKVEGEPLGHNWSDATCSQPAKCNRCGQESYSQMKEHSYSSKGICSVCGQTKEHGNSYGYFSSSELFAMAKDAIKDYAYPAYVSSFCSLSDIYIEKITDDRLLYGSDSFSVVASADFTSNQITKKKRFVVVIEPRDSTTYVCKDAYVE